MKKNIPAELTSYDFLKFLALALMIADHIGAYFMPEELWLRVAGRLSAPIWLFLIGYARSRGLSVTMLAGAFILMASNLVLGVSLLPVSILGTMLVCRIALDPMMNVIARAPVTLYPVTVLLFLATLPSFGFFEYGTAAMLFVMMGYMVRHAADLPFNRGQILLFTVIASGLYAFIQMLLFSEFDFAQGAVAGLGMVLLALALTRFRPAQYEGLSGKLASPIAGIVKIGGRWSLEFYVLHLLLFKAAVAILNPDAFRFFSFHIF